MELHSSIKLISYNSLKKKYMNESIVDIYKCLHTEEGFELKRLSFPHQVFFFFYIEKYTFYFSILRIDTIQSFKKYIMFNIIYCSVAGC